MDRYAPIDRRNNGPVNRRDHMRRDGPNVQSDVYRFGGRDNYRSGGRDSYRPDNRNEFSFRSSSSLPHSSRHYPSGQPDRLGPRSNGSKGPKSNRQKPQDRQDRYKGRPPQKRQWKPGPPTSSRPLLQGHRERTPEQLKGMGDGAARFKALEDLSDSDEEPMVMESDAESHYDTSGADIEPPRKVSRREPDSDITERDPPKWSNPDPYTSLPLPTELPAKRKDVVQLIRKAKAQPGGGQGVGDQNEDFISFNVGNESENNSADNEFHIRGIGAHTATISSIGEGVPNAPTGPSSWREHSTIINPNPLRFEIHKPPPKPPIDAREALQAQLAGEMDHTLPPPPPPSSSFYNSYPNHSKNDEHRASPPLPAIPPSSLQFTAPSYDKGGTKRKHHDELSDRKRPRKLDKVWVHPKWLPKRGGPDIMSTPWLTLDHSNTPDVAFRLHKEILDFYEYLKPREFENAVRQELVSQLSNFVSRRYSGAEIRYFGSFAAGLYLPDGDMDLVMLSREFMDNGTKVLGQSKKAIRKLGQQLKDARIARDGSLAIIFGAKVPIIKYVDQKTGLRVDISFENDTGLIANRTYLKWKAQYPAMPILVTLIKQFLIMRDLNEVHTGGIGGFSVTCLVISCMQHMPQIQTGAMDAMQNLGEVFMNFLNLYGNQFNTTMTGIEMEPPGYFPKQNHPKFNGKRPSSLCIIDPNKSDNDISGGSHNVLTAFKSFSMAFETLNQEMKFLQTCGLSERKGSILGSLYAGNYELYETRRAHLQSLYKRI